MESTAGKHNQFDSLEGNSGLEELNLVEFPLALLADRQQDGTKTVRFEDTIFDREQGQQVTRKVTVTGADAWGLPTGPDMDVLLAMMQLTQRKNRFQKPVVEFSLYELRELLGWQKSGHYKRRLKDSVLRWMGVSVAYENSWRKNGKWKSLHAFHLIERICLTNTQGAFFDATEAQCFKWSDVVVESVQENNTKGLDWDFYISLKSATSKRLYRFLDKRFGLQQRTNWDFNLTSFCTEKLGMSRGIPEPGKYRDKLLPAIKELEGRGFITDMPKSKRFERVGKGVYRVHFKRVRQTRKAKEFKAEREPVGLERQLLERDVRNAVELVANYPEERIREQMENFDHRNAKGEAKGGAWLRRAIEEPKGFGFRKDFETAAEKDAAEERRKTNAAAKQRLEAKEKAEQAAESQRTQAYIAKLSEDECRVLEEEGFKAFPFLQKMVTRNKDDKTYRVMALRMQVSSILKSQNGPASN